MYVVKIDGLYLMSFDDVRSHWSASVNDARLFTDHESAKRAALAYLVLRAFPLEYVALLNQAAQAVYGAILIE